MGAPPLHPFLRKFFDPLKNCIFGGSALWDLYAWMRNGRFYGGFNDCDLIFFLGVGLVALLRKRVFSFFLIWRFIKKCWDPFFRNQRAISYPKSPVSRDSAGLVQIQADLRFC